MKLFFLLVSSQHHVVMADSGDQIFLPLFIRMVVSECLCERWRSSGEANTAQC